MVEKVSDKTKKVTKEMSFKDLYTKIVSMKKKYTTHKYEVYNNVLHWPSILSTTEDHGEIFHLDYSENLSQQYKFEPQSSHFSKRQFSLHCTVKHTTDPNNLHLYKYCLSDEMKHDHIFTTTVLKQLTEESSSDITCIKSDNCSTQYKSKYIFKSYINLVAEIGKPIIAFYGTSGHGKGLVDAMSSSGVKGPLRTAVLLEDFSYDSSIDIMNYLINHFQNDRNKEYFLISREEIDNQRELIKGWFKIKGCIAMHMISFFPNGEIQTKRHICPCKQCVIGNFIDCSHEPGTKILATSKTVDDESDYESESDSDSDYDDNDSDTEYIMKEQAVRAECVTDAIAQNSHVALFSPPESFEHFYLCYVLKISIAEEDFANKYNHIISKGNTYITCQYLEKIKEKSGCVYYKLLKDSIYVLPAQVLSPFVALDKTVSMTAAEYQ